MNRAWTLLLALAGTLAVAGALIVLDGQSPLHVYTVFLQGTLGNPYGFAQVLFKATPLLFSALAFAVPARAGLFNVGAEGQLVAGAFAAATTGLLLPTTTPALCAWPMALLLGTLAGGGLGWIAGWLRATRGAHEVVTTIMLNFVTLALLNWIVSSHWNVPETMHTPPLPEKWNVPLFSQWIPAIAGSPLSLTLFVALAILALYGVFVSRTVAGLRLNLVGENEQAARHATVDVAATQLWSLAAGGMVAGLGGALFVLGYSHMYEEGFLSGVGFMGIAVALLGSNRAGFVLLAALFFGALSQGRLAINALVPKELFVVVQALVIFAVIAAQAQAKRGRP